MAGFKISKILKISALLLFSTNCATTQSAETVTLNFKEVDQSFHSYDATYLGLVKHIDNNMRFSYAPKQKTEVHSYKEVSANPDGLRVSSEPIFVNVTSAEKQNLNPKFKDMLERHNNLLAIQKAALIFKASHPDFIIDNAGKLVRYEITDQYKQQSKKLSAEILANFSESMGKLRLATPLMLIMKMQLGNAGSMTDKDYWPKDGPQWFNLSLLNGLTLDTSGTPVSGIQLQSDGKTGSLSFVKRLRCDNSQRSNSCVLLKFVPEQKPTGIKYESVTYLTVKPDNLTPYRWESGDRINFRPGNKKSADSFTIQVVYRTYAGISETVSKPDVGLLANRLFDLSAGKKATLEDFHSTYRSQLKSLNISKNTCKLDFEMEFKMGHMKNKFTRLNNFNCEKLKAFYTDEKQMSVISHMENLAANSKKSDHIKTSMNLVNGLMKKRPMFLAAVKLQGAKKSTAMDVDTEKKQMAQYVVETLESSPVTSRRHQEYSKKVIEAMELVMEGASMSEVNIDR